MFGTTHRQYHLLQEKQCIYGSEKIEKVQLEFVRGSREDEKYWENLKMTGKGGSWSHTPPANDKVASAPSLVAGNV